ncbi:MAG: hypothetical protein KAW56_02085 [Candidatus Marinimicrobia bacterium]|nr:hypothetical protein [candidate division WOR-3 bacterium]MCK4445851.1 hypothetical protein [Candidatus Neomarinimicrobiota bacterium]
MRNYRFDMRTQCLNIYKLESTCKEWIEKALAVFSCKVTEIVGGGSIEMWRDDKQTRSFLYIDECLDGVRRLMDSDFIGPINIGSEEMVTINELAQMIMDIAGKKLTIKHIPGPLCIHDRNSDNRLIKDKLGWAPNYPLKNWLIKTYN